MKPTEELLAAAERCRLIAGEAIDDSWEQHWLILAEWLEREGLKPDKLTGPGWRVPQERFWDREELRYSLWLAKEPCIKMARKINREAQP